MMPVKKHLWAHKGPAAVVENDYVCVRPWSSCRACGLHRVSGGRSWRFFWVEATDDAPTKTYGWLRKNPYPCP